MVFAHGGAAVPQRPFDDDGIRGGGGRYGPRSLVTLSYLNETFLNSVMRRVDEKIAAQGGGTQGGDTFTVVSMASGQTLTGGIGCEMMLRVGSAVCVSPSAPGLIDETTAGTLNGGGGLEKNHLYMMTIEGRGVKATSADAKLLVRGSYTIG